MNIFSFTGNVGKDDAVLRFTPGGAAVLGFSVAATSGYGDTKATMWVDVSYWGKPGEAVAPYVLKGSKVGVSGELSIREHEGKTYLKLRANSVTLLGSKPREEQQPGGFRDPPPEEEEEPEFGDDKIPF